MNAPMPYQDCEPTVVCAHCGQHLPKSEAWRKEIKGGHYAYYHVRCYEKPTRTWERRGG